MPRPTDLLRGTPPLTGEDTPVGAEVGVRPVPVLRQPLVVSVLGISTPTPPTPPPPGEGGSPVLSVERTTLAFTARTTDPIPAPLTVAVTNTGTGTLRVAIALSAGAPLQTTIAAQTAPTVLTVWALTTGVAPGVYTPTITITAEGATGSPQVITVTVTVLAAVTPADPLIAPIAKPLLLGYFQVAGRYALGQPAVSAGYTAEAIAGAGQVVVVGGGDTSVPGTAASDFTDLQNWRASQRLCAQAAWEAGGGLICTAQAADVENLAPMWDAQVVGGYWQDEAVDGGTAAERVEAQLRDYRAAIWARALTNKPAFVYFNGAQIDHPRWFPPAGMDVLVLDTYVDPGFSATDAGAQSALRQIIQTRLASLASRWPGVTRIVFAGQAYDRNGAWTNASSLVALQRVYAEFLRADPRLLGVLWFAYARPGGVLTYPALRPWHEATFRAAVSGRPALPTPSFRALGRVTRADCTQLEGWTFNPSAPNVQAQAQVFVGSRHAAAPGGSNVNRVAQVAANLAHTDPALTSATSLAATTRSHGQHWFRWVVPASLKDGLAKAYHVYGVDMSTGEQGPLVDSPRGLTCGSTTPPPPPPGGGGVTLPSLAQVVAWRSDFLNLLGDFSADVQHSSLLYPGESAARRSTMRAMLASRGFTHLPFAMWGAYSTLPTYDYRANVSGFRAILTECYQAGIVPCWFALTDQLSGPGWTEAQADAFLVDMVPRLRDLLSAVCLGWEINQVAGMSDGSVQIRLLRRLRELVGPAIPIYVHYEPYQWAGYVGQEVLWWETVGAACDGILYQVSPFDSVAFNLANALTASGPGGGGICGRIKALGKRFVLFESRRDQATHAQIRATVAADSRVDGFA